MYASVFHALEQLFCVWLTDPVSLILALGNETDRVVQLIVCRAVGLSAVLTELGGVLLHLFGPLTTEL